MESLVFFGLQPETGCATALKQRMSLQDNNKFGEEQLLIEHILHTVAFSQIFHNEFFGEILTVCGAW